MRELNELYCKTPALWEVDDSWEGFQWIVPDDNTQSVIAFLRRDKKGNQLICVCNFAPVRRQDYKIGVPKAGTYHELLNSDNLRFGGGGIGTAAIRTHKKPMHGFEQSISVDVPPMSALFLKVPATRAKAGESAAEKKAKEQKKTTAKKPAAKKETVKAQASAEATSAASAKTKPSAEKPAKNTKKAQPAAAKTVQAKPAAQPEKQAAPEKKPAPVPDKKETVQAAPAQPTKKAAKKTPAKAKKATP